MPPPPPTIGALRKLAEEASARVSQEMGQPVVCTFEGQPYGAQRKRRYRHDPSQWVVPKGETMTQQTVAFSWVLNGDEARRIAEQLKRDSVNPEDY